jgi:hypothetical protein
MAALEVDSLADRALYVPRPDGRGFGDATSDDR